MTQAQTKNGDKHTTETIVWGVRKSDGFLYSFLKDMRTQQRISNIVFYPPDEETLENIADFHEGVCGQNAKPENYGRAYSVWKVKETGDFVQGTFRFKDEEPKVETMKQTLNKPAGTKMMSTQSGRNNKNVKR